MGLVLQYVQEPQGGRGTYRYRRRVPAELKPYIGKGELISSLGQSQAEALKRYPAIHAAFEKQIAVAKTQLAREQRNHVSGEQTRLERYKELMDEIRALGIETPEAPPQDHEEAFLRATIAEHIAAQYEEHPETGHAIITDPEDAFKVRALMGTTPRVPAPTLDDAKKVYVAEKLDGTDFEFRKKLRRVERIIEVVTETLETVPTLDKWTRDHAKQVRDHYIKAGFKPASVKRELNTLKGMITCFIKETGAKFDNPFRGLELPKNIEAPSESRYPLPPEVLEKVRTDILSISRHDIVILWRLLEGTGCRIAEITGLRVEDVVTTGEFPHLKIVAHPQRRLKTDSSAREVPLVGDALEAAKDGLKLAGGELYVFPRYIKPAGPTSASAALMKRIRAVTEDPKHTVHSLRHGMADRLALAEVPSIDKNAILGHLNPGTGERHYGGKYAKLKILTRSMKRAFGLAPEEAP